MHTVVVYETLRHGEANHHLLHHAEPLADGVTFELFALVDLGGYPAAIVVPSGGRSSPIRGEVYCIEEETFRQLDELEDSPNYYSRSEFNIWLDAGRTLNAWMYFVPPNVRQSGVIFPSVDWRDRAKWCRGRIGVHSPGNLC